MEDFRFFIEQRVRFYETDLQGVLHHADYFRHFENARVEYMRNLNLIEGNDFVGDSTITVVRTDCSYKRPLRFDDAFKVYVRIADIKNASMTFEYKILRSDNSSLIAQGSTKIAAVERNNYKPTKIPQIMVDKIKVFEGL